MAFELVEQQGIKTSVRIKVIGVGGAGGNAVNNMIASNIVGVDLLVANTDAQDLERSKCKNRILLGPSVTRGNGCGGDPSLGERACEESIKELKDALCDADMVFIAAGMGGGTGTGACPIIAKALRELQREDEGILTVAVVTKPFPFEGSARMTRAVEGIEKLKSHVDSIIVLPNEKLLSLGTKNVRFRDLFLKADEVLFQAVKGISDLITRSGYVNLDFRDLRKVLSFPGQAIIGLAKGKGEDKVLETTKKAISSPLLENSDIRGARGLVMNFTGSSELSYDELVEAAQYLQELVKPEAETFWGLVFDDQMGDEVEVTVVATGMDGEGACAKKDVDRGDLLKKIREARPEDLQADWEVRKPGQVIYDPPLDHTPIHNQATRPHFEEKKPLKRKLTDLFKGGRDLDYPTILRLGNQPQKG
jgi:cell division protein FtsZ